MKVFPKGLAVLAEACGMASARALSPLSHHKRLNADLAATFALIRATQASLQRPQRDPPEIEAVERRLILVNAPAAETRSRKVADGSRVR